MKELEWLAVNECVYFILGCLGKGDASITISIAGGYECDREIKQADIAADITKYFYLIS